MKSPDFDNWPDIEADDKRRDKRSRWFSIPGVLLFSGSFVVGFTGLWSAVHLIVAGIMFFVGLLLMYIAACIRCGGYTVWGIRL